MNFIEKLRSRTHLFVIRVKPEELKRAIVIPIPLAIAEDLLTALCQLGRLAAHFVPKLNEKYKVPGTDFEIGVLAILEIGAAMVRNSRRLGRFTLVEVESEDVHVSMKFY